MVSKRRSGDPRDARSRLYDSYVSGGRGGFRARGIDDLGRKTAYLQKLVDRHFPADRTGPVLDLGCGSGALVHVARASGFLDVKGVDVSAEQVEEAGRLGIEGIRQQNLLEAVASLPPGSHAVIVTFDVIEHLTLDELFVLADEIFAALKPGGVWIIHAPNGESPFFGRIRYGDLTHQQVFTRQSMRQFFSASEFGTCECYEDRPTVRGLKSLVRAMLWVVLRQVIGVFLVVETGSAGSGIYSQNFVTVAVKE